MDREIERCRREIAAIEGELLAGNPDIAGLCLALTDWSEELRILEGLEPPRAKGPHAEDLSAD
jgi:hypothetical protein